MNERTSKGKGDVGELLALNYLQNLGYKILQRNYRYDRGEIDIIAEDHRELVFVEVKSRRSRSYGTPEDAVTPQKESYIKRTAEGYLLEHNFEGTPCRFDLIAIEWTGHEHEIRHIRKVF